MHNSLRTSLLLFIIGLMGFSLIAGAKNKWADEARKRKADYFYLEGINRENLGDPDASYELLREAYRLNPDDRAVGLDLSIFMLQMIQNDTTALQRAMGMMGQYYREHPEDYNSSYLYGSLLDYLGEDTLALAVWNDMHRRFPTRPQVTLHLAESLSALHDTAAVRQAIRLYDDLVVQEGESSELTMRKMGLYYLIGDTTAMITNTQAMLDKPGGRSAENLILAGSIYNALDRTDDAREYLMEACRVDSTSGEAFYALASFYHENGDSIGYDREVYNALKLSSLDPEVKGDLLRDYILRHITDSVMQPRILELFNVLVDEHPHEPSVRNVYSSYLSFLKRYPEAAEQLDYSLNLDPSQEDSWMTLIGLHQLEKDYTKANATADEALRYFPNDAWFYYIKATNYEAMKEYPEALVAIDTALVHCSDAQFGLMASLYTIKGSILYNLDRHDEAFAAFDKAMEKDPDNSLTLNNYAYFLSLDGRDLDKAEEMVKNAILIDPENANAVDTYAWVLFKKKDYPRAREVFDSALDEMLSDPNVSYEVFEHAGDIYFMTGDAEDALKYWEKALEMNPDSEILRRKVTNKTYFFQ